MTVDKIILDKLGQALVAEYRKALKKVDAFASGNLYKNTSYDINVNNDSYKIILNLEDYWKVVEEGRRRGSFPPPEAIKKWIRVKRIIPNKRMTLPQLTFVISKSISKRKIPGRHPLRTALGNITEELDSALEDIVDALLQPIKEELDKINK